MPYEMRKVPNEDCYKVYKPSAKKSKKKVFSKCTTKENAIKQLRLLRAIQFNKDFIPRKNVTKKKMVSLNKTKKFAVLNVKNKSTRKNKK